MLNIITTVANVSTIIIVCLCLVYYEAKSNHNAMAAFVGLGLWASVILLIQAYIYPVFNSSSNGIYSDLIIIETLLLSIGFTEYITKNTTQKQTDKTTDKGEIQNG